MNDSMALLSIHRLQVFGANLVSGELTWGFPSPTAFLGFAHALERRLRGKFDLRFEGVGIVCHKAEAQTSEDRFGGHQLRLTRNPLDKDGTLPSLVEVGRLHMRISLVIEVLGDYGDCHQFEQEVADILPTMRIAGGSVFPSRSNRDFEVRIESISDIESERREYFRKNRYRLLPGFALCGREDVLSDHIRLLRERYPGSDATALDALLDLSRRNYFSPASDDPDEPVKSVLRRDYPGWLVPIAIGYQAISPLYRAAEVMNSRDAEYPLQFVESVYSIAEWKSPHRLDGYGDFMWRRSSENEVYRCVSARAMATKENK